MLAKKVFAIIVVTGASYLVYKNMDLGLENFNPLQTSEFELAKNEFEQKIIALESQVSNLQALNQDLQNQVDQALSLAMQKPSIQENNVSEPDAILEIDSKFTPALSENDKRLRQQAQLRALADKHELAAISALNR